MEVADGGLEVAGSGGIRGHSRLRPRLASYVAFVDRFKYAIIALWVAILAVALSQVAVVFSRRALACVLPPPLLTQ